MTAIAAICRGPGEPFAVEPVEIALPGAGEILVRIRAVGICHTDLIFAAGAMGSPFPLVLGHEGAGVVAAVGAGVAKVAVGDQVLLTFASCGACEPCRGHDPAYCHAFLPLNFPGVDPGRTSPISQDGVPVGGGFFGQSSFASYAIATERNVVRVGADDDLTAIAPLGCGIQTGIGAVLRSLDAQPGSSLVVIGAGAVGLSAVIGGVLADCTTIVAIEPQAARRELALSLGAHHALDPAAGDGAAAVRAIVPAGADLIVDTSGNADALAAAIGMLAHKGKLGLVGAPAAIDAALSVPILPALTAGFSVHGICEGDSDPDTFLPELVAYWRAGRLPIERFITHYPFDQINQAIADTQAGRCVKPVLVLEP